MSTRIFIKFFSQVRNEKKIPKNFGIEKIPLKFLGISPSHEKMSIAKFFVAPSPVKW